MNFALLPKQDYLPPKVHEAFLTTLTEFVLLPWREAQRSRLEGASQGGSQVRCNTSLHFKRQMDNSLLLCVAPVQVACFQAGFDITTSAQNGL